MNYDNLPKGTKVLLKKRIDCSDVAIETLNDCYGKIVTVDKRYGTQRNYVKEINGAMFFIDMEIEKIIILGKVE